MHRHEQGDGGGEGRRGDGEPPQRGNHGPGAGPLRERDLQGGVQLVAGGPTNISKVQIDLTGIVYM